MMDSGRLLEGGTELTPADWGGVTGAQGIYGIPARERTLGDWWRILRKRKWTVIVSLVVVVTAAALISLRMTPIYDATVRISISSQTPGVLNLKNGQQYQDQSDSPELLVATDVNILQSDTLALLVIRNLGLNNRPEFAGKDTSTTAPGGVPTTGSPRTLGREAQLLGVFHANLKVIPVPNTSIIEIRYSSPDPRMSAEVANAVADTFIEQNIKARFDSTMQAANWLSKQLADLQIKVESSQSKLIQYQKENGIVGTDDKQNLTFEKLNDLGKQLTLAQSDRIQKESLYQIAKGNNPDTLTAVLQESMLTDLRRQLNQLQTQYAQLSTQFGPSYPKVIEIQNQINQVNKAYQEELLNGVHRVETDYFSAVKREQMLKQALAEQTTVANQLDENAIQYKILKQEADSNRQLYDGLLEKLKEASLEAGLNSSNIRVVDKARIPLAPARPNVPRNMLFATLLGLLGGIAAAFALEAVDNTVRTPDQAQSLSGLPVMAAIPMKLSASAAGGKAGRLEVASRRGVRPAALIVYLEPHSEIAEAYRTLRTSILLSSAGHPPRVILFTSALPQDGKSMTSINTALVMAKQGKRVLLVDADLRRPSIHKAFGLRPEVGLSNVLSGGAKSRNVVLETVEPHLFLMPSGPLPPHPSELLGSASMQELLQEWRRDYDYVIIDSPPVLSVTDAVLLAVQADMVALVVRSGQTSTGAVRNARDLLLHFKAPLRGIVLNAFDLQSPDYYHYYYSGSKYGGYYTDESAPKLVVDDGNGGTPNADIEPEKQASTAASS